MYDINTVRLAIEAVRCAIAEQRLFISRTRLCREFDEIDNDLRGLKNLHQAELIIDRLIKLLVSKETSASPLISSRILTLEAIRGILPNVQIRMADQLVRQLHEELSSDFSDVAHQLRLILQESYSGAEILDSASIVIERLPDSSTIRKNCLDRLQTLATSITLELQPVDV